MHDRVPHARGYGWVDRLELDATLGRAGSDPAPARRGRDRPDPFPGTSSRDTSPAQDSLAVAANARTSAGSTQPPRGASPPSPHRGRAASPTYEREAETRRTAARGRSLLGKAATG